MRKIKTFEAFTLPGRNITELIKSCFQDMLDEQGEHVKMEINPHRKNIFTQITIDQQLKKSEIEEFCDEYVLPGIDRVADEGFKLDYTRKPGILLTLLGAGKEQHEHFYNGIKAEIDGNTTEIYFWFKNELK